MKYGIVLLMLAFTACTKEFKDENNLEIKDENRIRKQADTIPMPIRYQGVAIMPQ